MKLLLFLAIVAIATPSFAESPSLATAPRSPLRHASATSMN